MDLMRQIQGSSKSGLKSPLQNFQGFLRCGLFLRCGAVRFNRTARHRTILLLTKPHRYEKNKNAPHRTVGFYKKFTNVGCEYNRLNGWNSTLQAAWYIRRVRIIWFLWTKPTIWWLILSFTQNIVRRIINLKRKNTHTPHRRIGVSYGADRADP